MEVQNDQSDKQPVANVMNVEKKVMTLSEIKQQQEEWAQNDVMFRRLLGIGAEKKEIRQKNIEKV